MRSSHKKSYIGKAIVLILACSSATIAQAPRSGRVAPRIIGVFDARTGAPLAGVQVRDAFSGAYATTTVTGNVLLTFLTFRGTAALLQLRKLGYQPAEVVLARDDTVPITEVMEPLTELAPMVTTEKYRLDRDAGTWAGLEQRCQSKSVTCVRAEELERRPAANVADFLIRADGMTIGPCSSGGGSRGAGRNTQCGRIAMHSLVTPPAYCEPTFFVDGYEWSSRVDPPVDLVPNTPASAPYTPGNVKAIEVYPPERARPLRFQGDPMCGVVVIWTK